MSRIWPSLRLASCLLFAIAPTSASADGDACDAVCLEQILELYVLALREGDPSILPVATNVRSTENGKDVDPRQGIWGRVSRLSDYRIIASDPVSGHAIYMGILDEAGVPNSFAVRIHVTNRLIDEIELAVGRDGHTPEGDARLAAMTQARAGLSDPASPTPIAARDALLDGVAEYYSAVGVPKGGRVRFDPGCNRIENGISYTNNPEHLLSYVAESGEPLPNFTAMTCEEQLSSGIWSGDTVTEARIPIVDERRGIVVVLGNYNVFGRAPCAETREFGIVCPEQETPPLTLRFSEVFRITEQGIREIESVWYLAQYPAKAIW